MTEKDLEIAIEKCERIMEFDTRTMENPESENGYIFEKVYDLLQFLQQFQFDTDKNVGGNQDVLDHLCAMPPAQKHGTWIVRYFGAEAKCSECGMYYADAYDHDRCDQYCRCCGAKMEGLELEGGQNERSD